MHGAIFKSFGGTSLSTDDYQVSIIADENAVVSPSVSPVIASRGTRAPVYTTQARKDDKLVLTVQIRDRVNLATLTDALYALFAVEVDEIRKLVVTDSTNADWYANAKPFNIQALGPILFRITLVVPDKVWFAETVSTETATITASGQTVTVTVGGTSPARPVIRIKPQASKTSGLQYRRFVAVTNPTVRMMATYQIELTGGGLNTATLVSGGKMQSDGDDWRIFINGKNAARWLADMNTSASKLWITRGLAPGRTMTLDGGITAGALTYLQLKLTDKTTLSKMPERGLVQIGTEILSYDGRNLTLARLQNVKRAARWTTAAIHADGSTVIWIPMDIVMGYGNSALSAPAQSDMYKPIINQSSSTNMSMVYADFGAGTIYGTVSNVFPAGAWAGDILRGGGSYVYSGLQNTQTDPYDSMGVAAKCQQIRGLWRGETVDGVWTLYSPVGFTHVAAMAGYIRRESADWPAVAGVEKSLDGITWTSVFNLSAPTTTATWQAWSQSSVSLGGTYYYLRLRFAGSLLARANNAAYVEVNSATLTLASANAPQVTLGSEYSSSYHLEGKLTNAANSRSIELDFLMKIGETLELDCEALTAVYSEDSTNALGAIVDLSEFANFVLEVGDNVITYTETGSPADVALAFDWRDRASGI